MKKLLIPLLLAVLLPAVANAQTHYTVQVGSGTETNSYVPSYGNYNYSYCQSIYHASEVGIDGVIDTIAFQVADGSLTRTLIVYMAEVNKGSFSSSTDAVAATHFQRVFKGSVSLSMGWATIGLDSTFTYQDTADLIIAVIDSSGSWSGSFPNFSGTMMTADRSLYAYDDYTIYTLSSPLTYSTHFVPNIRLGITSTSEYCATPSNVAVSNIVGTDATITWQENGTATSWEVLVSDTMVTDFTFVSPVTVTSTTYTVTGLSGNHPYYVYVRADCSASSISGWSNGTFFRSACIGSTAVPFSTGFEDITTGQLPNCWLQLSTGSSGAGTFPAAYEYPSNARNSNVYFEFESNYRETELVALPVMDDINTLYLSFYASVMNSNFTLEVGVMEDSLFVPVDTVALTPGANNNWGGSYYPYTVYFSDYTGNGDRIAIRVTPLSNGYTLMMDDFVVDEIPSCLPPTRFRVDSIGADWVALGWHDVGEATDWEVVYDTVPFNPATSTTLLPVAAFDTSVVIDELSFETTYYAYLRANCGDYSPWVGPLTFVPGHYIMPYSGSDTIRTCGLTIYDDGGENGDYTTYADFTLVVYPTSEDSIVTFWGDMNVYSYYARLRVYEGVGTNGTLLFQSSSANDYQTIPYTRSFAGPITVRFTAGSYSYYNSGFELHTSCEAAPSCATVSNVNANIVGTGSAHLMWNVSGTNHGTPTGYEVECHEVATNTIVSTGTATSTAYTLVGLNAATEYKAFVRAVCDNEQYGSWDSTLFTTTHLPCLAFDTTIHDSVMVSGTGSATTYQLPLDNYYGNSFTEQLVLSSELSGSTVISGIDFEYVSNTLNTGKNNCTIYLANTEATSLLDSYAPYDSANFRAVYSGSLVCTTGWNHFEFTTPFEYDGSKNLLVAVVDNSGSWISTSCTFSAHPITGLARYISSDYNTYDITNDPGGSALGYRNNMRFHIAGCTETATCARPTVMVDSVGVNQIDLSWAPGYQETSWVVQYKAADDTTWIDEGTLPVTSYTFSALLPDTRYNFRIGANCTDTTMFTTMSVRTVCVPGTLPFVEGFESFGYTTPACWFMDGNYSWGNYPAPTSNYVHSGSMALDMYSSNDSYSYIALPNLAAPIDSLEVSFWMLKTYDASPLEVGVMTDPEDINTFYRVATVMSEQANTWKAVHVSLSGYTGSGTRIAIVSPEGEYVSACIDDISVDYIRTCSRLTNVAVSNIGSDSAMVTWNGMGNDEFEVEYGPTGFVHDSGMVVTSTLDTVVLHGLTPNTGYDVYVRTFCDDGDTSTWSDLYTFRTNCLMVNALPYTQDFESVPAGMGGGYDEFLLPCWTRYIFPGEEYYYPYVDSWSGHNSTYGLYWYWSNYYNFDYIITLPALDTNVLHIDSLQLSFWALNNSTYTDVPVFHIGVMNDPTVLSSFQPVDTVTVPSTNWTLFEIPLNRYTGHGNYIAIKAGATFNYGSWNAAMDDVTVEPIPSCPHVGNVTMTSNTATSVTIGWTERGEATTWEVALDTNSMAIPVADSTVSGTPSFTFNGLTSGQYYYAWVRAICSSDDVSNWEGPTLVIPNSWNMRTNTTDTIYMCNGVVFDDGGPLEIYSDGQNSTLVLMPTDSNSIISVSGRSQTGGNYSYLSVYDGPNTSSPLLWTDYSLYDAVTFGPFISSNGPITLSFYSNNSSLYDGFEVNVSCLSTHCRVMNARINPSVPQSDNQLALIWDDNGALYYQVEYDTSGTPQGSGTLLTTTTNNIVIPGLATLGVYDVYIRSICGVGDTGDWVRFKFQTAVCNGMSVVESFDNTMSHATSNYAPIGYSYYNYSYVQTIIDSAQLAELDGDISAFAFLPAMTTAGSYYTNMTIYMANVHENDLSAAFIVPDTNHQFVKVLDNADLCYDVADWQVHSLDTTFAWDGHSNLLFVVKRDHGDYYNGSSFSVHNTAGVKTRYGYNDNDPYSITNANNVATYNTYSGNFVGDLRFYTCNGTACPQPVITSETHNYESATISWSGTGTTYEVNIKEAAAADWPVPTTVAATSYTFNALRSATNYIYRVRQDCTADSLGYSEWTEGTFTTDSLPCFPPQGLTVTDFTNATATFDWTPLSSETVWDIHVWSTGDIDSIYRVTSHPATVGGFTAGLTYNAAVRAVCGGALEEGDWSASISFTTATCPNVTNVSAGNVTANSALIVWDLDDMAESWVVEYGFAGFDQGSGTIVPCTANSFNATGLECETSYDFYVRAVCGTDWTSENWAHVSFTTGECTDVCDAPFGVTATVNQNTVDVNWTPGDGNTAFEVEYGSRGFSHGSGTTVNATEPHATLTGLDYNTQYDLYVRALCGADNYSGWSPVTTFTTGTEGISSADGATCTIFPNPATNSTTISVGGVNGKVKIEVVDMNGRTVATETLECNSDCVKTMEVDKLAQGAYFVRISGEQVNMVRKLIVK